MMGIAGIIQKLDDWFFVLSKRNKNVRYVRKLLLYLFRPDLYVRRRWMTPRLDPELRNAVDALARSGFVDVTEVMDLKLVGQLKEIGAQRKKELISEPKEEGRGGKNYWRSGIKKEDLSSQSIFVQIALQKPVLEIISNYIRQVPILVDMSLFLSEFTDDPKFHRSQLWHRDWTDSRVVKLFVYLTPVTSDADGPFTLIPAGSKNQGRLPYAPTHKSDLEMEKVGMLEDRVKILGNEGKAFLVDTFRCFHMGSRVEPGHQRLMYVANYETYANFRKAPKNFNFGPDASPLEKMVMS